ncbi:MAG: hypothetical protein ACR5LD_11950 [Symbiopectobacterium sp.]
MTILAFIGNIEWMTLLLLNSETCILDTAPIVASTQSLTMIRFIIILMCPCLRNWRALVPKRRMEFLVGRYLARHVLEKLGINQFTLLSGQDRSPVWPENLCGSLNHNKDSVLCAIHCRRGGCGKH